VRLPNGMTIHAANAANDVHMLDYSNCSMLIDVTPLAVLTSLTALRLLGSVRLTDVSALAACGNMRTLDLSQCAQLPNLSGVETMAQLVQLNCSDCASLTDVGALKGTTAALPLVDLNLNRCAALCDTLPLGDLVDTLVALDLSHCKKLNWNCIAPNKVSFEYLFYQSTPTYTLSSLSFPSYISTPNNRTTTTKNSTQIQWECLMNLYRATLNQKLAALHQVEPAVADLRQSIFDKRIGHDTTVCAVAHSQQDGGYADGGVRMAQAHALRVSGRHGETTRRNRRRHQVLNRPKNTS
jgi:hypothetical protein